MNAPFHGMTSTLGRQVLVRLLTGAEVTRLLFGALRHAPAFFTRGAGAVRSVFLKQIYFSGLEAAAIIIVIAMLLGTVVVTQIVSLVGASGSVAGKTLVWIIVRELAPLLTAIIVIARSGTAIAAELGSMKINGEIECLEMLGISPRTYLIMPRVCGVTASVVILTIYFVLTAFIGSFLIASIGWHIPYEHFIQGILSTLSLKELCMLMIKSLLFGLAISATCCCHGLGVDRSATEIPQAATRAVMSSLLSVFLLDVVVTYLFSFLPHSI